jgi:hypothetical protein
LDLKDFEKSKVATFEVATSGWSIGPARNGGCGKSA